jgi:hypothetical protein
VREQSIAEIVASSAEERTQLYGLFKPPELLEFLKIRWPILCAAVSWGMLMYSEKAL